ncbi:MAG: glycosyltransferase [Bacillota bacterium]|nr:glycosyltransferase [Bacillota bacterium]
MRPYRIAFFTDSFREDLGGLTRAVIGLHDVLVARGHQVFVFTLPQREGRIHQGNVFKVPALPLPPVGFVPPDSHLAVGPGWVEARLRELQPEIVHLHTPYSVGWLGLRAARRLGLPVAASYHANPAAAGAFLLRVGFRAAPQLPQEAGRSLAARALATFYNRCDVVIAPSRYAAALARESGVRRAVTVLPTGIDAALFRGVLPGAGESPFPADSRRGAERREGPRRVTALYAGRLSAEKDLGTLERAARACLAADPSLCLRIAGDGPLRRRMEARLSSLVRAGRVEFAGPVPWAEMPGEYRRADLFLFPSPVETQGLAVLEAMASGLPVVACAAGGVAELVEHGQTGFLAPPRAHRELSAWVLELARKPGLRRALGRKASQAAGRYDWGEVVLAFEGLYGQLRRGVLK